MKLMKNKIFSLIAILFLSILSVLSGICPTFVRADTTATNFDKTNVLDDLKSSKDFNILDYPYSLLEDKIAIINFVEYCYSFKP